MSIAPPSIDLISILPEILVTLIGIALLFVEFIDKRLVKYTSYISIAACVVVFISSAMLWNGNARIEFSGLIVRDNFSTFFEMLFMGIAGLTFLLSDFQLKESKYEMPEFYSLIFFALLGMMVMAISNDLITVFIGLETLSISLYVLAGFFKKSRRSTEAGLKYFFLGAFSTAFLLYGIAFIYGATGTTNLVEVSNYIKNVAPSGNTYLFIGTALIIVGLGFKAALVPFHMWSPDVYEGAPTSVTAFMSAGPKMAAFAAILRVFDTALAPIEIDWIWILWGLAVLTMTLGNLSALVQQNIKRMLAYSSIAHAGYIMLGILAASQFGTTAILFYGVAYSLMNIGVFAGAIHIAGGKNDGYAIENYRGLGFKKPYLAAGLTVLLFSLTGVPPTAGFVGKFYLFGSAVDAGFIWLAVIAALNSALSIYYYLRITVLMYMKDEKEDSQVPAHLPLSLSCAIIIAVLGTVYLGIFPGGLYEVVSSSVIRLM